MNKLTEVDLRLAKNLVEGVGYPIPFHALDTPLVESLTRIIRAYAEELEKLKTG